MFRRILVGLDGSRREAAVLKHAVALADACGGELYLCRAVQIPRGIPAGAWTLQGGEFEGFLLDHTRRELERLRDELPDGLVAQQACEVGQPADVICRIAQERVVDLIIVGSHGYDRVDRLLGTTAAKIVNRAPCSVTVVRENLDNETPGR